MAASQLLNRNIMWKQILAIVAILAIAVTLAGCYFQWGTPTSGLVLPGTVEVQEVQLSSKIGGRVLEVLVVDGERVEKDEELVILDVPELLAQRDQLVARLQAAQATWEKLDTGPLPEEFAAAKAEMEAAEARWKRATKGRDEEIEQARRTIEAWDADLQGALREVNRLRPLVAMKTASQTEYDAAVSKLNRLQAEIMVAESKLKMVQTGGRPEDQAEMKAEFEKAQANYHLLLRKSRKEDLAFAAAQIEELKGKQKELEANLAEAVIRAPEAAVVELVSVRPGVSVTPNQTVLRLLRDSDLWIKAFVPETELGRVRLNQSVEVTMDTYPDRLFVGRVVYIASASEFTPRNVQSVDERRNQVFAIKVRVEDKEGIFKSGMAADVRLPNEPDSASKAPKKAS